MQILARNRLHRQSAGCAGSGKTSVGFKEPDCARRVRHCDERDRRTNAEYRRRACTARIVRARIQRSVGNTADWAASLPGGVQTGSDGHNRSLRWDTTVSTWTNIGSENSAKGLSGKIGAQARGLTVPSKSSTNRHLCFGGKPPQIKEGRARTADHRARGR